MKVVVFGASGGIGQCVVSAARAAGHQVTAVSRTPLNVPDGVDVRVGDVLDPAFVAAAVAGHDAVLCALGIRRINQKNPWSPLASPPDFLGRFTPSLVAAMRQHRVPRVLAVSAAGVGDSRPGLNWMMRFFVQYTNVGYNYRDLESLEATLAASGLDWCCVRPTGLKDGPAGAVRTLTGFPFDAWIPRASVAQWMVEHLTQDLSANRTPILSEQR